MRRNNMLRDGKIQIAQNAAGEPLFLLPGMANRHGLVAGATGTGKTVTLKVMAESFSDMGVPVFMADVKGDIASLMAPGQDTEDMRERVERFGLAEHGFQYQGYPVTLWDIYGEKGIQLRTTVTEMGPVLLSRILGLNDLQSDVLEPALNIGDFLTVGANGKGMINILDSESLVNDGTLYSSFLLWLLSELFDRLPEVGDLDKPKLVFFFDEAHLLFKNTSKNLLDKIEQVVKLVRSKGVGVYFCTQNPRDVPDGVLSQLGNKIQHGLHAYTPADMRAVKAAAESFRPNPEFNTFEVIQNLGTGEAVVSFLGEDGIPSVCEKAFILPPQSRFGAITAEERDRQIKGSLLYTKYYEAYDPDSAYEFLERRGIELEQKAEEARREAEEAKIKAAAERQAAKEAEAAAKQAAREAAAAERQAAKEAEAAQRAAQREAERQEREKKRAMKSVASTVVGTVGREAGKAVGSSFGSLGKTVGGNLGASLGRNILGTLFKV